MKTVGKESTNSERAEAAAGVYAPQHLPVSGSSAVRVAIFGGSGYGGSELLRILLFHPNVKIVFVTANEQAGKAVGEVHRNLSGLTDLNFIRAPEKPELLTDIDCVFF